MRKIIVIAHNLRSAHNVGSLLRTADGLGIEHVYFSGYTPCPRYDGDERLPHIVAKLEKQIHKTALGAETSQPWSHVDIKILIPALKKQGYVVYGLEQDTNAHALPTVSPSDVVAVILGREVEGLEPEIMALCDKLIEIPMFGQKESFNVVQAAAMSMYHFRFAPCERK